MKTLQDTKALPEKAFVDNAEHEQTEESEESSPILGLTRLQHIGIDLLIVAVNAALLALLYFIETYSIPLVDLIPYVLLLLASCAAVLSIQDLKRLIGMPLIFLFGLAHFLLPESDSCADWFLLPCFTAFVYSAVLLVRAAFRSIRLAFQNAAGIIRRVRGVNYVQNSLSHHR